MSPSTQYKQNERKKLVQGILVLGMGLGLAFGVWLITFIMVAPWRNSPPEPTPTLGFTPEEEIEQSAYYACAKQFEPSQFDSVTGGSDNISIETWSIVPYPRFGYPVDRDNNLGPAVGKVEDNSYLVHLLVDYTLVAVNRIPEYNYEETTRNSYRGVWMCDARYLGTENGTKRWDAKILWLSWE